MITRRLFLSHSAAVSAAAATGSASTAAAADTVSPPTPQMSPVEFKKFTRLAFLIGTMSPAEREEAARLLQAELNRRKEQQS